MARKRFSDEEKIDIIMKCRRSGLSDYQWCDVNAVNVGTFYNWVSKLRKKGCDIYIKVNLKRCGIGSSLVC